MTKAPHLPHALGLERFTLADSPLPPGIIPRNVSQKDFIRQVGGFKGSSDRFGLHLKPRAHRTRSFESPHQTFAHELLDHEIQKLKAAHRNEDRDLALEGSIDALALQTVSGPREHPSYILESEAVRQNMGLQSADSIVRTLATLPSAPTAEPADAEHHFLFGGSKRQKRKLDRKIRNAQRAAEANVDARKEQLVQSNLRTLHGMYAQAASRLNLSAGTGQCEGVIPNQAGADSGASGSPMASAAAGSSCGSCGDTKRRTTSAASSASSSLPIVGLGIGVALVVVVVILAAMGGNKNKK